jgi:hypothetical protein
MASIYHFSINVYIYEVEYFVVEVKQSFSSWKEKIKLELGELKDGVEPLSTFLQSKVEPDVTSSGNKPWVNSKTVSLKELKRW